MNLSLIAALSKNRVIGKNSQLPWHLPKDLQYFKALTLNKPILMGRKTFESIGHVLPKRRNIIVTHQRDYHVPDAEVYESIASALAALNQAPEIMVIGGETLYQQTIAHAQTLYLTLVETVIDHGDAFFPEWNTDEWEIIGRDPHPADAQHAFAYTFLTLRRIIRK